MVIKLLELAGIIKTAFAEGGTGVPQSFTLPNPFSTLTCASGATGLVCVVEKLADFLLLIGAPLATIMVLVGCYMMVTAAGSSEKFSTGKKTILYAAIGLAVIILSKGVAVVIQDIFK